MMRRFLSIIKIVTICGIGFFVYGCESGGDGWPVGDFRLSEEARGFIFSDTIGKPFKMIDSHDISYDFINSPYMGKKYLNIGKHSDTNSYEAFNVYTRSQLSGYNFHFDMSTVFGSSGLILWVNNFITMTYEFDGKRVYDQVKPDPEIKFYDSMEVRGTVYQNIMEIDYSKTGKTDNAFPTKIYYSGSTGLIKFIRKDGIYFERI